MINFIFGISLFLNIVLIIALVRINKYIEEANDILEIILKDVR